MVSGTWDRVQELMGLQAGWLDGAGAKPEPQALLRAGVLAEAIPTEQQVRIYPSEDGGVNLEWDDANLLHCITIGPDLRLDLMTVDKDEAPLRTPATQASEPRCVCGDPIQWMDHPDDPGWIHTPGSDTTCLDARPSIAGPATVADRPACPCCTSGDHNDPCACDGVACCCPGRHSEVRL